MKYKFFILSVLILVGTAFFHKASADVVVSQGVATITDGGLATIEYGDIPTTNTWCTVWYGMSEGFYTSPGFTDGISPCQDFIDTKLGSEDFDLSSYTTPGQYNIYVAYCNITSDCATIDSAQYAKYYNFYFNGVTWSSSNFSEVVFLDSPSSGSEITSDTTTLDGSWLFSSIDNFDGFNIAFLTTDGSVSLTSHTVFVPISDLTGSFSIPLSQFAFSYSANWIPIIVGHHKIPDSFDPGIDFAPAIGRNLVSPSDYNLDINFDGLLASPLETCEAIDVTLFVIPAELNLPCQLHNFFLWVFVPDPRELSTLLFNIKDKLLNIWPIGYINRLIVILSTTDVIEPPAITYTLGTGITDHTDLTGSYSFQVFDHLDTVLEIHDDVNGKNIWDIFMPFWNIVIYLSLFMVILTRLAREDLGHILDSQQHGQKHKQNIPPPK